MSQAYGKTPSDLYGVQDAAGLFFDTGVFLFGRWVESEVQDAERNASNEMFANMYRDRAFARCMGDDMSTSAVGFADPFADGAVTTIEPGSGNRRRRSKGREQADGEILWDEAAS